jgi:hypothetical protein
LHKSAGSMLAGVGLADTRQAKVSHKRGHAIS